MLAWHEALRGGRDRIVGVAHPSQDRHVGRPLDQHAFRETGIAIEPARIERLRRLHAEAYNGPPAIRPLPGARELLADVERGRLPWAIATTGRMETAGPVLANRRRLRRAPVITRDKVRTPSRTPTVPRRRGALGQPIESACVVGDTSGTCSPPGGPPLAGGRFVRRLWRGRIVQPRLPRLRGSGRPPQAPRRGRRQAVVRREDLPDRAFGRSRRKRLLPLAFEPASRRARRPVVKRRPPVRRARPVPARSAGRCRQICEIGSGVAFTYKPIASISPPSRSHARAERPGSRVRTVPVGGRGLRHPRVHDGVLGRQCRRRAACSRRNLADGDHGSAGASCPSSSSAHSGGARRRLAGASPQQRPHPLHGDMRFTVFNALFYVAAHYTTAVNISILQGAVPVFVIVGAALFHRVRIGPVRSRHRNHADRRSRGRHPGSPCHARRLQAELRRRAHDRRLLPLCGLYAGAARPAAHSEHGVLLGDGAPCVRYVAPAARL